SEMLRLLREAATMPAVSVTIGRENPMTGMWEASVVAAPYEAGGQAMGTIGVVGPLRMDYAAAITAVRAVADRLSAAVAAPARRRQYDLFGGGPQGGGFETFPFGDFGDLFDVFFGGGIGGRRRAGGRQRTRVHRGEDLLVQLSLSFEEAAFGGEHEVAID